MINRLMFVLLGAALLVAQHGGPAAFNSPEEARDALIQAADKGLDSVKTLFGPGSGDVVRTGDDVEDQNALARFKRLAAEKTLLEPDPMNPDRVTLLIGTVEWPMAVPIVRKGGRWLFDIQEGKAEIRRRTIGGNELDAIEICRGYVEAQELYAETDWDGNGVLEYAKKIVSSEGKKDGLYWPGEDSPVAAGFAKAAAQGYTASPTGATEAVPRVLLQGAPLAGPRCAGGRAGLRRARADDRGVCPRCLADGVRCFRYQGLHGQPGHDRLRKRSRSQHRHLGQSDNPVQPR